MENLKNPDFSAERDVLMISDKAHQLKDSVEDISLKANVILLSYNRPRMIREAIESVVSQTYPNLNLWIADDGSDFEFKEILDYFKDDRITVFQAPKISIEDRIARSRVAENINRIMDWIPSEEVVYYLCDDDIMAPQWISRSMQALQTAKEYHIVQGNSWSFKDGEDWHKESYEGMPLPFEDSTPRLWWSTGSFCHRASCYHEENITWHDSEYGHSQDTLFIKDLWETHTQYLIIDKPAVYRREHDNMLSSLLGRKDETGRYKPGFVPPPLDKDMIIGWMESEG